MRNEERKRTISSDKEQELQFPRASELGVRKMDFD